MRSVDYYVEKMKKWPFFFLISICLPIGIFLCALLGRSVGIQGPALAISVVWPATGLSLAALLLFGYRAGFGIFLGNFAYNFHFLMEPGIASGIDLLHMAVVAFFISLGSLIQAMVSAYIIFAYSTPLIFRTVQDIFIFLVPAGLLSCLIGSTLGITTLLLSGGVDTSLALPTWLTFWLGDTVGIYVITPLIVVWALQLKTFNFKEHIPSILCMVFLFAILSWITYYMDYPLPHLFVPISIWASYLLRMHGASVAIFLMTAASLAFATFHGYEGTSLISLITFIGVTVASSLIIAAVVNERAEAWSLLDSRNIYLEKEVDVKAEILEQVKSDASRKRIATLTPQDIKIHKLLNNMDLVIKNSHETIEETLMLLKTQKKLSSEEKSLLQEKLHRISQGFSEINHSKKLIADALQNLSRS